MDMEFTIAWKKCDTCGKTNDSFVWYARVDGDLHNVMTECYECDLDTDPQAVRDMDEIEELL